MKIRFADKNRYAENPFRYILERRRYVVPDGGKEVVDRETGEVSLLIKASRSRTVLHDPKVFTKVYESKRAVVMGLSPSATKVFMYVCFTLKPFSVEITLMEDDCCKECDLSKNTFYKAVEELIDADIIAIQMGATHRFWVNPNFLMNGSCTKLPKYMQVVEDHIEKVATIDDGLNS